MIERINKSELEAVVDRLYLKADLAIFAFWNMMLETEKKTQPESDTIQSA